MIRRLVIAIGERLIRRVAGTREADFVIGGHANPYLRRWWLIPRNRFFNVYLHQFLRSDDDRALHDHPWANASILLRGGYLEHLPGVDGRDELRLLLAPAVRVRWSGRLSHRIELLVDAVVDGIPQERSCWTLFITGPRYREWGFCCPQAWIHWKKFTAADDVGAVGKGCDQ